MPRPTSGARWPRRSARSAATTRSRGCKALDAGDDAELDAAARSRGADGGSHGQARRGVVDRERRRAAGAARGPARLPAGARARCSATSWRRSGSRRTRSAIAAPSSGSTGRSRRCSPSRLWATAAIPIPLPPARRRRARGGDHADDHGAGDARAACARGRAGRSAGGSGSRSGHKRAIVWRVARDVTAAVPELVNDPTATTWDVLVDDEARTLALVPRRLDDPRFAYRVADVPAASHPTVAAALARLGEARATDRVWDPFCGSGLELVERARRGPARSLVGTDLDGGALDAARENLEAAGVRAELAIADARTHAPGPIDLILTNPPLGSRVQVDAAALLVAALPNFARALAPRGRLVWITPSPRKTSPVAEQLGLARTRSFAVDLGGVRGQLERWDRR